LGQFSKNYRTFYPKNYQKALKKYGLGIRDPRSGIRKNLFRIPDPGVKKAPDPGSGSATLVRRVLIPDLVRRVLILDLVRRVLIPDLARRVLSRESR
jgi:hypothetical protein